MTDGKLTSEVRMVATSVVEQQARYCAAKMDSLGDQVSRLTNIIEKMREDDQKTREALVVMDQRWKLFTAIGSVLAVVLMVIELVRALQGMI